MPHTKHDVNDVVLLVSVIYACEDGHRILTHDAQVLKMITSHSLVPFELSTSNWLPARASEQDNWRASETLFVASYPQTFFLAKFLRNLD